MHGARLAGQWLLRARVFTRGDSRGGKRAPNMALDSVEDGDALRARSLLFVSCDGRRQVRRPYRTRRRGGGDEHEIDGAQEIDAVPEARSEALDVAPLRLVRYGRLT